MMLEEQHLNGRGKEGGLESTEWGGSRRHAIFPKEWRATATRARAGAGGGAAMGRSRTRRRRLARFGTEHTWDGEKVGTKN